MTREQLSLKHRQLWVTLGIILAVVLIICIGFAIYVGDYYHAGEAAVQAMALADNLSVSRIGADTIVFAPAEPQAGLIFYPGGKVEYTAYAPLMRACAENGILCVLIRMPGNLAVLDVNAADGIMEQYTAVNSWYIGGHSLGGAMAAIYAANHSSELNGLILLAAYSTSDLKNSGLEVLSIYGTEDKVLDFEKYEKYRNNLPLETTEFVVDGGCHAGFGFYGPQDGDGTPTIANEEQIALTAEEITAVVLGSQE